MDLHISNPNLEGKLACYEPNWALITQDGWVLSAITGYKLQNATPQYRDFMLTGRACKNLLGDQGTPGQRSHSRSSSHPMQLCLSNLPGGEEEEGWGGGEEGNRGQ